MTPKESETQRLSTARDKFYMPALASQDLVRSLRSLLPPRPRARP